MARTAKKEEVKNEANMTDENIRVLEEQIKALEERIASLEYKPEVKSIHHTEEFNGEQPFEGRESQMKMGFADKIFSMRNAIKILPPNLIVNGRHAASNIEAICGFKVDSAMMDEAYSDYTHGE